MYADALHALAQAALGRIEREPLLHVKRLLAEHAAEGRAAGAQRACPAQGAPAREPLLDDDIHQALLEAEQAGRAAHARDAAERLLAIEQLRDERLQLGGES